MSFLRLILVPMCRNHLHKFTFLSFLKLMEEVGESDKWELIVPKESRHV